MIRRLRVGWPTYGLVVLVIGVCASANAVIFSLFSAALWRPLSLYSPEQLIVISAGNPRHPGNYNGVSGSDASLIKHTVGTLGLCSETRIPTTENAILDGNVIVTTVSRNDGMIFHALGQPLMFTQGASNPSPILTNGQAVISARYWKTVLGGSSIDGRHITLGNRELTIVGVVPASAYQNLIFQPDVWAVDDTTKSPTNGASSYIVMRLNADVRPERVQAVLNHQRLADLSQGKADDGNSTLTEVSLKHFISAGANIETPLEMLFTATVMLLLIGCGNIAFMLAAETARRTNEIVLKIALGATRGSLISTLLKELTAVALCGAGVAVIFAAAGIKVLRNHLTFNDYVSSLNPSLDVSVLLFTVLACLFGTVLGGLIPILVVVRQAPSQLLHSESRNISQSRGRKLTQGLIMSVEVTLAVISLSAATLVTRSFADMRQGQWTFNPSTIATADLTYIGSEANVSVTSSTRRILAALLKRDGVRESAAVTTLPGLADEKILLSSAASDNPKKVWSFAADPGFFEFAKMPFLEGGTFSSRYSPSGPREVIVNRAFEHVLLRGQRALGTTLYLTDPSGERSPATVVGVLADQLSEIGEASYQPQVWSSLYQVPSIRHVLILVQGPGSQSVLLQALKHQATEGNVPGTLTNIEAASIRIEQSEAGDELFASLLSTFALISTGLCVCGLYAITRLYVNDEQRALAIKLVLGASRTSVVRRVISDVVIQSGGGLLIGSLLALLLPSLLKAAFSGLRVNAVPVLVGVPLSIAALGGLGLIIPATKSWFIQPSRILRP